MKNYYIKDYQLTREIILSKQKGIISEKLKLYLYEICERINYKFTYNDSDMRYDIKMNSYLYTLKYYNKFNEKKYSKSLPFISEIIKRAQATYFNKFKNKYFVGVDRKIDFVSMDDKLYTI